MAKEIILSKKDIARFWSYVDVRTEDECWEWKAGKSSGYGRLSVGKTEYKAHRIAWVITNGRQTRDGYEICHVPLICHNRACCNPKHLIEATPQENSDHRAIDGTNLVGDKNPSRLYPERLARGDKSGARLHPNSLRRGDNHPRRLHPELFPSGNNHPRKIHPELFAHGERAGGVKLTAEKVNEIIALFRTGKYSKLKLSRMFGVSDVQIGNIVRGKSWKQDVKVE